jgi:tetratricopeptide (TPR) repeat protein
MALQQPFERLPVETYIGRESQKELLRQWTQTVTQEPRCAVLCFLAGGGLGKTRLLEHYPWLAKAVSSTLRWAGIIDLYDYESRSPDVIERKLIDGLHTIPPGLPQIPSEAITAAFQEHARLYEEYVQVRGTPEEDQGYRERLRQSFISGWNSLTSTYALAMSFDTIETLFSHPAPPEAIVHFSETGTGARMVLDWMQYVLPQLQHTLVLLSGRKIEPFFLESLQQASSQENRLQVVPVQQLSPFQEIDEAARYLQRYDIPVRDIPLILQSTGGRPLLMACYAELGRAFPIADSGLPVIRADLEEKLIEHILNPLRPELYHAERTRVLCLYFLANARRGIRRDDLYTLCTLRPEWVPEPDREVIDQLHQLAIVKERQFTPPGPSEPGDDGDEDTRFLFLHDEIQLLLDNHEHDEEVIEAGDMVLAHLCAISKQQVQRARRPAALLKTMADHLFYEMTRDIKHGYFLYQVYADWLIRERHIDEVVLLSDVFWSTLNTTVRRHGRDAYPYREALAESDLLEEDILRDQQVLQVKLLDASDRYAEAMERADQLYDQFVREQIFPPTLETETPQAISHSHYLYVDLNLIRAITTIQARADVDEPIAEDIFSHVIQLLENATTMPAQEELLRLRRRYFLGQAYLEQAFLRRQQQRFAEAEVAAELGRKAFRDYREKHVDAAIKQSSAMLLNDRVDTELAHITNNLAFVLAWSGNLSRALRLSNEVIKNYLDAVSDYKKALFYNTNALIQMRFGHYSEARDAIQQAEQTAIAARSSRARGLVAQARAQLARYEMKTQHVANQAIEQDYLEATTLLKNEPDALREIAYDQVGFARDISVIYRNQGDHAAALRYQQQALSIIDETLAMLSEEPSIHLADCLQCKVSVLNEMHRYEQAAQVLDQTETIMHARMPDYVQVVCGKIALQRAFLALYHAKDFAVALRFLAIALARAYTFAGEHRDQITFEQLVRRWSKDIPAHAIQTFRQATQNEHIYVAACDLPYQHPNVARWADSWERSIHFLHEHFEDMA